MALKIHTLSGPDLLAHLDDLARLRIAVFRDWPYLYEGSLEYERGYIQRYANARTGTIVVAMDGEFVVGAATALALDEEMPDVKAPFLKAGMDLAPIFYFGESVLLPRYRGRRIGVRFFEQREEAARAHGRRICAFCAVQRPADHPARPQDYVPLDEFWRHRGYAPRPDLVSEFSWRDIGEAAATPKPMQYWLKDLGP